MNEKPSNDRPPDESASDEPLTDALSVDSVTTSPERSEGSGSGSLARWSIAIVVVAALAAGGFLYFASSEDADLPNPLDERIASLSALLEESRQSVDALDARIRELEGRTAGRDQQFQIIEDQLSERLRSLDSLPGRVGKLEGSLASLRGISSGLRESWLLAEAEYYMQIANAQLQLAGNPRLAMLALQLADEKIQQLANPALTEVRRALADELRALDSIDKPDIEGIALTLASLSAVADSLPLDSNIEVPGADKAEVDTELTGMDRFFASLRKTAADVVSVRRSDQAVRPLVAPEAQYFLRTNLALQFQAARIALLRGEQSLYDQSLDDATTWLNRYYDTESAPVRSALQTISEARQKVMPVSLPDISGSLRLLREYRLLSTEPPVAPTSTPQPAPAEPESGGNDEAAQ
jgi:uroporphyrin-III C-methyltransferase